MDHLSDSCPVTWTAWGNTRHLILPLHLRVRHLTSPYVKSTTATMVSAVSVQPAGSCMRASGMRASGAKDRILSRHAKHPVKRECSSVSKAEYCNRLELYKAWHLIWDMVFNLTMHMILTCSLCALQCHVIMLVYSYTFLFGIQASCVIAQLYTIC